MMTVPCALSDREEKMDSEPRRRRQDSLSLNRPTTHLYTRGKMPRRTASRSTKLSANRGSV